MEYRKLVKKVAFLSRKAVKSWFMAYLLGFTFDIDNGKRGDERGVQS